MKLIPQELMLMHVAALLDVDNPGGANELRTIGGPGPMTADINLRTEGHRLTLGEVMDQNMLSDKGTYMLMEFADDGSPTQGEGHVIAHLNRRWWYLGPWATEGCREVRRCGLGRHPDNSPEPRYSIGMTAFLATTKDDQLKVNCPDCLGEGNWPVQSRAGYEGTVECPRCRGRGKLGQRCYSANSQVVTIRKVETTTGPRETGEAIQYCGGTNGGYLYYEWQLFDFREDADALSEVLAGLTNASLEKHEPRRVRERELMYLRITDAKLKEAEDRAFNAEHDLLYLRERVMSLLEEEFSLYIAGKVTEDEGYDGGSIFNDEAHPTGGQRERIVAWIMSQWDSDGEFYLTSKADKRQEDCSC